MRPSIRGMLDCQIRIWRPITVDDALGAEDRTYVPMATVDAFINRPMQPLGNLGGGLAPAGGVRWYGLPTISVLPRDICEVMTGPEIGKTFEVNAPPVRPKNHHTQVDCIEWHGILPDLGTDSGTDSGTISEPSWVDSLAAQASLLSAWKPNTTTQTFPDDKSARDFAFIDPAAQGFTWANESGIDGPLVGFGIGVDNGDLSAHQQHAQADWPALNFFTLHYVIKNDGVYEGSLTSFDVIDALLNEILYIPSYAADAVDPFPAATGFSYVDAADDGSFTQFDEWWQPDPSSSDYPRATSLTDIAISLGSDGFARVWINGTLKLEVLATGAQRKLIALAGKLVTGGAGAGSSDGNFYLGPVVLYGDAITTADVVANRTFFKTLGYTSLP